MIRRYVIFAAITGIGACAATSPEMTEDHASVAKPATDSNTAAAEDQIVVVEVPKVPMSANRPGPAKTTCRRETPIGSRRAKRICRTQSEIDKSQAAAQKTLDDLQSTQDIQRSPIEF